MATTVKYKPIAIFDNVAALKSAKVPQHILPKFNEDYDRTKSFLLSYQNNAATFNSFRREIERFVQFCWFNAEKSSVDMKRLDIEDYLGFCQKPPISWIGLKNVMRFIDKNGSRVPNPTWRPFLATVSKSDRKHGKTPKRKDYCLSEKGFRENFYRA